MYPQEGVMKVRFGKKLKVVTIVLVLLFSATAVHLSSRKPAVRLVYEGKDLDEWLRPVQMFSPYRSQETDEQRTAGIAAAEKVINHFGTNAIPYALEQISSRDPWWRRFLMQHKFYKAATFSGWEWAAAKQGRGVFCLYVLGRDAERAVPRLQQMLENPHTVGPAAMSLFVMSSNSAKLPLAYITNQNPLLRRPVITAMCNAEYEGASKLSAADSAWGRKAGFTIQLPNGSRTY